MRVVLLLPKLNAGAEWALNRLLEHDDIDVVGVVRSDNSPLKKRYWKYLFYGIRRWGVFYAFLIGLFYMLHVFGVFLAGFWWWRKKRWKSVDFLIKKHGLLVHDTDNVNSAKSLKEIASWQPDVMVSLYFDQILKKDALQLAKVMNLNMHPGPLPSYKGLWPCFWQLYNRATKAGVTVHQMTEKIDAGKVFGFLQFPITKQETKHSLMVKTGHYGAQLLLDILRKLKNGVPLHPLKKTGKAVYYSLPSRDQFREFSARGRKLFSICFEVEQIDQLG